MYIKYKSLKTEEIIIINVNVAQCIRIITEENKLIIVMDNIMENTSLSFLSKEDAIKAQEKMFTTFMLKSPLGNILDLTQLDEIINIEDTNKVSEIPNEELGKEEV